MVSQVLRVNQETVFKRRPLQSTELPAEERHVVPAGSKFELQSYAYADANGDFDGHIKIALRNASDYIRGLTTWYVYNRHAQVEFDGKVVYPQEEQTAVQLLKITEDTVLKRRPLQSSELKSDEIHRVPKGTSFILHSYAYADAQGRFNNHIKIALRDQKDFIQGFSTWYVYDRHAQVEFDGKVLYPLTPAPAIVQPLSPEVKPTGPQPTYRGRSFKLPGNQSTFYTDQPILPNGSFTWGEATHGGDRIPKTTAEVSNILALAKELQKARDQIGRPFMITSWYRPEPFNTIAGGVSNSQHLGGRAVDLWVDGYTGRQIANQVMLWWPGGVGTYPGSRIHIVHLDVGPRRQWGW